MYAAKKIALQKERPPLARPLRGLCTTSSLGGNNELRSTTSSGAELTGCAAEGLRKKRLAKRSFNRDALGAITGHTQAGRDKKGKLCYIGGSDN